MKRITKVKPLVGYKLDLEFADGTKGVADVSGMVGMGVFSSWENFDDFCRVQIGSTGELIWSDQVDLCADSLYLKISGKNPDDIFPALKPEAASA